MHIKHAFVELDTGQQEFFLSSYEAFVYARDQERLRKNSVEYVAIGDFYETEGSVYRGQELRHLIRALDNEYEWIMAQVVWDDDIHE